MKHVIFEIDGSISAVHRAHSGEPTATGDRSILEVPNSDWPDNFNIDAFEVQDGTLVEV